MTSIKVGEFERALKATGGLARALLLHGQDEGLVGELAQRAAQRLAELHNPQGEILRLQEQDLAEEPDRAIVELRTVPMFGGPVVLRLRAGAHLKPELVDALIEAAQDAGGVVIEAGALKKDAKLRKQFEAAPNAAAIACYSDTGADLSRLVDEVLGEAGLTIAAEARTHLVDLLGADRALSRNEIEKLALYADGQAEITIEDIDAVVGDSAAQAVDRVTMAAASGDGALAIRELDRAIAAGQATQTILLALQRHMLRLQDLAIAVEEGKSPEVAIRSARPPIHFALHSDVSRQLRRWRGRSLERGCYVVQRVIADCRRTPALEDALAAMALVELARLSQAGT